MGLPPLAWSKTLGGVCGINLTATAYKNKLDTMESA
jgi:hypothetical protein